MAGTLGIVTGTGILRSGATCIARVRGQTGQLITQASLSAIVYAVRDLTAGSTIVSAQALTISTVVFDSLVQNDPRWDKDSAARPGKDGAYGYNFLAVIPATNFTAVDVGAGTGVLSPYAVTPHRYQIAIKFTPISGQVFIQPFEFTSLPVWES